MKRLPLLLLAVGCWSSVQATHDWETGGLDKRSTEEEDCLVDCKKDTILSVQACLQKCKITKRSTEEVSVQDPPPQPWQVNGPGKRSANIHLECWRLCGAQEYDCIDECERVHYKIGNCTLKCSSKSTLGGAHSPKNLCLNGCGNFTKRSVSAQDRPPQPWQVNGPGKRAAEEEDCLVDCKKDYPKLSVQACLQKCQIGKRSTEEVSAQDPPPQPWQVNGPGKRAAEQYRPWSGNYSEILHMEERVAHESQNCTLECYRRTNFSRSACQHMCNDRTKRSVSAQDPPPQPWKVNGPGKRSAEESSCFGDCIAQGGHSANCASACQGCFPPQCYYRGHGKRSTEEGDCAQKCDREYRKCRSKNFVPTGCRNPGCVAKCEATKRSTEDEKLSAQDPPSQPWQVNGPGKRAAEEEDCLVDCKKDYPTLSVQACLQKCQIGKRSIEETLGL